MRNTLYVLFFQLDVHNSLNQGAVEICASKGFMTLLEYFILRDFENLRVWKILFKMLCSNTEDKVESAGACLRHLTAVSSTGVNSNWEPFYRNGANFRQISYDYCQQCLSFKFQNHYFSIIKWQINHYAKNNNICPLINDVSLFLCKIIN